MKWIANAFWLLAFAQWLWYTEWFSMVYEARERDVVVVFIVVVVFLLPDSSDSFCFISQIKAFLYKRQNLYETLMHTVCVSGRMFVYREWRQKKIVLVLSVYRIAPECVRYKYKHRTAHFTLNHSHSICIRLLLLLIVLWIHAALRIQKRKTTSRECTTTIHTHTHTCTRPYSHTVTNEEYKRKPQPNRNEPNKAIDRCRILGRNVGFSVCVCIVSCRPYVCLM